MNVLSSKELSISKSNSSSLFHCIIKLKLKLMYYMSNFAIANYFCRKCNLVTKIKKNIGFGLYKCYFWILYNWKVFASNIGNLNMKF